MPNKSKTYEKSAPRVYIRTFGCQMNEHDSGRVRDLLLQEGYSLSKDQEEADVLLFNTCSVRKHAEDRVFGRVGSLRKRPGVIIGILGCMVEAQKDLIFRKLPHVDFICGPADLDKIPEIIERIRSGAGRIIYVGGHASKRIPEFPEKRDVGKNAYVKITEGCANFCSYCIVPYVRGPERSRPSKEILKEIEMLIGGGVKKITLLGQNVNSYGRGLKEKISFSELLRKIDCFARLSAKPRASLAMTGVEIDFVTSHPKDAGIDLFKVMAELNSFSKQLHMPLQSGSNKILKRMNRGYTVERYKKLAKDFRRIVKDGKLASDFIVGFPGETKKDFNDTLKAIKEIRFSNAYIFKYSPRPFTKAGKFKDDVPKEEKERRHALLLETQKEISLCK